MRLEYTQLTPHLWVFQSRLFATNSGVWISQGAAALVDPALYPDEIERIAHFLRERGATPQFIFLTHSHWDHIFGPEHFPGAPIVAHASFTRSASEPKARTLETVHAFEAKHGIRRAQPFIIPTPDIVFEDTLDLQVGGLPLRLYHSPGHAADQYALYQPETRALWAADMLSDLEIPFVSHSLDAYQQTLAPFQFLPIRALVPGHGAPTIDPEEIDRRLTEDIAYLVRIRACAERAIADRRPIEHAVAACAGLTFRHPEQNAAPHRANVEQAYLELGGSADPTQVGWAKDWSME